MRAVAQSRSSYGLQPHEVGESKFRVVLVLFLGYLVEAGPAAGCWWWYSYLVARWHEACGWPGGAGRWLANARRQTPLCWANHSDPPLVARFEKRELNIRVA